MPCTYWGPGEEAEEYRKKLGEVTRIACTLSKTLEKNGIEIPESVKEWWVAHQKMDFEREKAELLEKAKEVARKSALAKLTSTEKKALGIHE